MVEIRVRYEGDLRCTATHAPSGDQLTTDAPTDNHGRGEAFSPTDLVATALGTCILTILGIAAREHGWDLTGATARVEKHMESDPRRRIARLEVVIRLPRSLDEKAREILRRRAHGCPVHASLSPDVEVPIRFEWNGASRG